MVRRKPWICCIAQIFQNFKLNLHNKLLLGTKHMAKKPGCFHLGMVRRKPWIYCKAQNLQNFKLNLHNELLLGIKHTAQKWEYF